MYTIEFCTIALLIGNDSDDGRDPSFSNAPSNRPTYISLDDAKELFGHAARNLPIPEPRPPIVDITRGYLPKWDHGKDKFHHFEFLVEIFMKRHRIYHLLHNRCESHEQDIHDQAVMIITAQLKRDDQRTVKSMAGLHTIWEFLVRKYHPSIEADQAKLLRLWEKCQKGNRSAKDYMSDIISLEEQLAALDHTMPKFLVHAKLFACGPEFEIVRAAVETTLRTRSMSYFEIMGEYVAFEERRGLQRTFRPSNDSRRPGGQRNSGAGGGGDPAGNCLALKDKQDSRTCFNCGKQGHLEVDCPDHTEEVRSYLRKQKKRREEARKKRGSRRQ